MIEIGEKQYEYDLTGLFWSYVPTDDEDKKLTALIDKVCCAYLVDRSKDGTNKNRLIANIVLSTAEQELVRWYGLLEHKNLEVRTRFSDVMLRFASGNSKLDLRRKASDGYLKLYEETGTIFYTGTADIRRNKPIQTCFFSVCHTEVAKIIAELSC